MVEVNPTNGNLDLFDAAPFVINSSAETQVEINGKPGADITDVPSNVMASEVDLLADQTIAESSKALGLADLKTFVISDKLEDSNEEKPKENMSTNGVGALGVFNLLEDKVLGDLPVTNSAGDGDIIPNKHAENIADNLQDINTEEKGLKEPIVMDEDRGFFNLLEDNGLADPLDANTEANDYNKPTNAEDLQGISSKDISSKELEVHQSVTDESRGFFNLLEDKALPDDVNEEVNEDNSVNNAENLLGIGSVEKSSKESEKHKFGALGVFNLLEENTKEDLSLENNVNINPMEHNKDNNADDVLGRMIENISPPPKEQDGEKFENSFDDLLSKSTEHKSSKESVTDESRGFFNLLEDKADLLFVNKEDDEHNKGSNAEDFLGMNTEGTEDNSSKEIEELKIGALGVINLLEDKTTADISFKSTEIISPKERKAEINAEDFLDIPTTKDTSSQESEEHKVGTKAGEDKLFFDFSGENTEDINPKEHYNGTTSEVLLGMKTEDTSSKEAEEHTIGITAIGALRSFNLLADKQIEDLNIEDTSPKSFSQDNLDSLNFQGTSQATTQDVAFGSVKSYVKIFNSVDEDNESSTGDITEKTSPPRLKKTFSNSFGESFLDSKPEDSNERVGEFDSPGNVSEHNDEYLNLNAGERRSRLSRGVRESSESQGEDLTFSPSRDIDQNSNHETAIDSDSSAQHEEKRGRSNEVMDSELNRSVRIEREVFGKEEAEKQLKEQDMARSMIDAGMVAVQGENQILVGEEHNTVETIGGVEDVPDRGSVEDLAADRLIGNISKEAIKNAEEEDAKKKAEEEAIMKANEEEAKRRAEEEATRKEEEVARKSAEDAIIVAAEEAAKKAAEVEAARKAAEEEASRIAAAEEAAKLEAAEEAARIASEEQAASKAAEVEAAIKVAEEEAARKAAEEEEARRTSEEAARKAEEEEAARIAAAAEDARLVAKEEASRKAVAEEAARKAAEEEAARKTAAEEAARKAAEEEAARKAAEEEAAGKAAEEEAARIAAAEEAARLVAEEEASRKAAAEEAARKAAEEEATRKAAEEEAARKAAEEEAARKAAEEEATRKAASEEAARKAAEEEAARKAASEEAARKAAEEEAARIAAGKAAEDAVRKAEEEAVARKAAEEEEARIQANRKSEEVAKQIAYEEYLSNAQRTEEQAKTQAEQYTKSLGST